MADLLVTATAGLRTFQTALNVTGHNVANVNTEGYSRQAVNIQAGTPQLTGGGYIGSGANAQSINRIYEGFLVDQINSSYSFQNRYKTSDIYSTQLNATLGDPNTGIFSSMEGYFQSWHNMANDPSTTSSPRFLLDAGSTLQQQLQTYRNTRSDMHNQVNSAMVAVVEQVNNLAGQLVDVNSQLGALTKRNDLPPNDLLDKRDDLVKQLNKYMDVKVFQNPNGTIDVYSSNGKVPLITDNRAITLSVDYNSLQKYDSRTGSVVLNDKQEVWIQQPGTGQRIVVTDYLKGGELAGATMFRKDQLSRAEDELGLSTVGMGILMNAQSRQGFDKGGIRGTDIFTLNSSVTLPAPYVNAYSTNAGTLALNVTGNASPNFSYKVTFNGATYDVTDASTGAAIPGGTGVTFPQTFNGVTIKTLGGAAVGGDSFLINTTSPKLMPNANSYANMNNTGTQSIATTGAPIANFAYKFTFNGTSYDITDAYSQASIATGITPAALAAGVVYNGVNITSGVGTPAVGDNFTVYSTSDFYAGLEQTAYKDSRNSGTIPNGAITVNLDRTGLSNNASGSKYVANDLSNTADFDQVQKQLAKLQPRSYSIGFDGKNYTVTDSRTGILVPITQGVDDPVGHPQTTTLRFEGLQVDLDTSQGTVRPGDQFQVRFLNDGVIGFSQTMLNPDMIAYRGSDTNMTANGGRPKGLGNNVNAANMASLQDKKVLLNYSESVQGAYSLMAGNVGAYHQANKTNMATQDAIYNQLNQTQQGISGVNLDEEAANMMKFQQAYQAAAQIMQASQKMFDAIMGVM